MVGLGRNSGAIMRIVLVCCSVRLARRREIHFQEFERIFRVMDHLGQSGGSIASKMAAAFELRKYPEYRDVIIRVCRETEVRGDSAKMLKDEMMLTAEYLEGK